MYIPSVKKAFEPYDYYQLHSKAWFVGSPTEREKKILDEGYPRLHYWGSVGIFLGMALLGASTLLIGLAHWWALGIVLLGGVGAIANMPIGLAYRQKVRKDLIADKALVIGDYYSTSLDIRIGAITRIMPPKMDWQFLSERESFKIAVDGFLLDAPVLEAVKLYNSGLLESSAQVEELIEALVKRAEEMFKEINSLYYDKPLSLDDAIYGLTGMPRKANTEEE